MNKKTDKKNNKKIIGIILIIIGLYLIISNIFVYMVFAPTNYKHVLESKEDVIKYLKEYPNGSYEVLNRKEKKDTGGFSCNGDSYISYSWTIKDTKLHHTFELYEELELMLNSSIVTEEGQSASKPTCKLVVKSR